jgi:polysaccharide export outer membrane protein
MVSALRAVSMMGGMNDTRADPKGILVLRRYQPHAAGAASAPAKPRVVFSFDLTRADGMFVADEFALQDGDIVMATQAPATTLQRVLGLFGGVLGAGRAVSNL